MSRRSVTAAHTECAALVREVYADTHRSVRSPGTPRGRASARAWPARRRALSARTPARSSRPGAQRSPPPTPGKCSLLLNLLPLQSNHKTRFIARKQS